MSLRLYLPAEDDPPEKPRRWRQSKVVQWINTPQADMCSAAVIILNAVALGFDVQVPDGSGAFSEALFWIEFSFTAFFVVELLWRVLADGCIVFHPLQGWGILDAIIIAMSGVEYFAKWSGGENSGLGAVSAMRVFRLLRVARLVRVLQICPELGRLISGIAASVRAVFWILVFLMVCMYMFALISALELGRSDNEELQSLFGSVGSSFFTHFMIMTMESYPDIVRLAGKESVFWYFYFVGYLIFTGMVLMNVVTGIVCDCVVRAARDEELLTHLYDKESQKFRQVLEGIFNQENIPLDIDFTLEDFRKIIAHRDVREAVNTLDIGLEVEDWLLFLIMDEDASGSVSFEEFFQALMRLRGSKDCMHSLIVQADLIRTGHRFKEQLAIAERDLARGSQALSGTLHQRLLSQVEEIQRALDRAASGQQRESTAGARSRGRRRRRPQGCRAPSAASAPARSAAQPAAADSLKASQEDGGADAGAALGEPADAEPSAVAGGAVGRLRVGARRFLPNFLHLAGPPPDDNGGGADADAAGDACTVVPSASSGPGRGGASADLEAFAVAVSARAAAAAGAAAADLGADAAGAAAGDAAAWGSEGTAGEASPPANAGTESDMVATGDVWHESVEKQRSADPPQANPKRLHEDKVDAILRLAEARAAEARLEIERIQNQIKASRRRIAELRVQLHCCDQEVEADFPPPELVKEEEDQAHGVLEAAPIAETLGDPVAEALAEAPGLSSEVDQDGTATGDVEEAHEAESQSPSKKRREGSAAMTLKRRLEAKLAEASAAARSRRASPGPRRGRQDQRIRLLDSMDRTHSPEARRAARAAIHGTGLPGG